MSTTVGKTVGLDFEKLRFAKEPMTSAAALRDVIPMPWSDDIRSERISAVCFGHRKEKEGMSLP